MSSLLNFLEKINKSVSQDTKKYVYFCKDTGTIQKITNTKDQDCNFSCLESDISEVKDIMTGEKTVFEYKVVFDINQKRFKLENLYQESVYSVDSYLYEIPRYSSNNNIVFKREYIGIHVDVWYDELDHLAGQHVWYNNAVYRLINDQDKNTEFNIDNTELVIDNVKLFDDENKSLEFDRNVSKGDNILRNNKIFSVHIDSSIIEDNIDDYIDTKEIEKNLTPVYQGIHVDVWYDELEHLAGQHVWYNNAVYRLINDQEANTEFDIDNTELVIDNVKLFDDENKSLEFSRLIDRNDLVLNNNSLCLSKTSNTQFKVVRKHKNTHDIKIIQNNKYNFWSININKDIKFNLLSNKNLISKKLLFFITEKENPNALLKTIEIDIETLLLKSDIIIPYQDDFEFDNKEVSIYTYKILEIYSHEVIE